MENDNEVDLRPAPGISSNQQPWDVKLGSNKGAGANANANSNSSLRIDTTVVGTRPLSELVWSTQNGLSIKCASCSNTCFADQKKKPPPCCCILRDVISRRSISPCPLLGSSLSHTDENVGEVKCVHLTGIEIGNKCKEKECMSSSKSIPDGNVAGTSEGPKRRIIDILPVLLLAKEPENTGDGSDRFSLDLKRQDISQDRPLPDLTSPGCAPFVEKIAENDVIVKDDSHGESGNTRWRFEEHLIIESKRSKKQSPHPHPAVAAVFKQQDRSFMNWISNMVKGVKPIGIDDHKTLNLVTKGYSFQTVFHSLYSKDAKTPIQTSKSTEIISFNKTVSYHAPNDDVDDVSASVGFKTPCKIDAFKDTRPACLQINENTNVLFKNKESNLNEIPNQIASTSEKNRYKILKIPKQMFDIIKKLRLSRTDILKWMNSRLPIPNLDGYFLRLRLAKWEEGVGEAGYYVACITTGSNKSICVKIGGVQCLVESRYISNYDFLQDELVAWWRTTLTSGRAAIIEQNLTSKLEERNKLCL